MIGFVESTISLVASRLLLASARDPHFRQRRVLWPAGYRRNAAASWARGITHSVAGLGNAVTPPIIAALVLAFSWRGSLIIVRVARFIWVVMWAIYFQDDPHDHPGITVADLARLKPKLVAQTRKAVSLKMAALTHAAGDANRLLLRVDPLALNRQPSFFLHEYHPNHSALFASGVFLSGVVVIAGEADGRASRTGGHHLGVARVFRLHVAGPLHPRLADDRGTFYLVPSFSQS
jgi:MFS family permease